MSIDAETDSFSDAELNHAINDLLPLMCKDLKRAQIMFEQITISDESRDKYKRAAMRLGGKIQTLRDFIVRDYGADEYDEDSSDFIENVQNIVSCYAKKYNIKVKREAD